MGDCLNLPSHTLQNSLCVPNGGHARFHEAVRWAVEGGVAPRGRGLFLGLPLARLLIVELYATDAAVTLWGHKRERAGKAHVANMGGGSVRLGNDNGIGVPQMGGGTAGSLVGSLCGRLRAEGSGTHLEHGRIRSQAAMEMEAELKPRLRRYLRLRRAKRDLVRLGFRCRRRR